MKMKILFVALTGILMHPSVDFAAANFEHYILRYENTQSYDIKLSDNTITWESLSGDDKGQKETDYMKKKNLSKDTTVIQWQENDGTFVTLILDLKNLQVISSGKLSTHSWLLSGKIEVVQKQ